MPKDKKWKCPFCGSPTPYIELPYVEVNDKGIYEKKTQPCCKWSGQNQKWINQHENPITHERQTLDEVQKW